VIAIPDSKFIGTAMLPPLVAVFLLTETVAPSSTVTVTFFVSARVVTERLSKQILRSFSLRRVPKAVTAASLLTVPSVVFASIACFVS